MPTNAWRRSAGFMPLAALGALGADYPRPNNHIIAVWSHEAIGSDIGGFITNNFGSAAYPVASGAIAVPFSVAHRFTVRKVFWFNGATATTDSVDVGVYTEAGARLVAGGGTAASGANATQEVDVTDTTLQPGRYWMAYVQNGTTLTPMRFSSTPLPLRSMGLAQMTSAYPLPSTFTPAAISTVTSLPLFGIASRTLAS